MFVCPLTLAALAFIPVVLAEGSINGLLQALNASGLDKLANDIESLNGTTVGQSILTQLSRGNKTIFAPTDSALCHVDPPIINETSLADIISYHIVSGNFTNQTQTYPNVTIGRTLLNDSALVKLEGNQSQVLIWSRSDNGSLFVINQGSNITVVNATSYNNSTIFIVGSVLIPPANISTILNNASHDLTAVAAILNSTTILHGGSFLDILSSAHGITVFAPDNAGVQAAQSSLTALSKNTTALLNVFENHVINGTSVYSTELFNRTTNLRSAGGQAYSFVTNSTGSFVSVGGSNQVRIVQTNVLTSNGVIHIVNGVMLDTSSNTAGASSALASATSVAAQTSKTGSIISPSQTGGAKARANNWKLGWLAGMIAGFGRFV